MAFYHSEEEKPEPMNLSSQCLNSLHHLSLCIIGIAESEIPIDVNKIMAVVRVDLMRVNPGFSSIVVRKDGRQWWKRAEVKFDEHLVIPTFPQGLSPEAYTKYFDEYLSKIGLENLPESRPLWELHIIKYPTQSAAGTLVFKMSHALGDGFSIMGAVFSIFKRADNPSIPLTFPSSSPNSVEKKTLFRKGLNLLEGCFYTVSDMASSMLHTAFFGDDENPVRSGTPLVERLPQLTTRVTLSLEDVRQVKSKIGVTVNDIVVGLIFYGVHLYTEAMDKSAAKSGKSALVVLNTRMLIGYRNLEEMLKQNMWGNQFSFIHLPVPCYPDGQNVDLTKFILQARNIIKRNKNSTAVYLNGLLLSIMDRVRGPEAVSKYVHSVFRNTSFTISNLVGPMEKVTIADHPISNMYFTVSGVPQSLVFPVISYKGNLTIGITAEKAFIDSQLLASCMNEAFKKIVEETLM